MEPLTHPLFAAIVAVGIVLCVVYLRYLFKALLKSSAERFEPPSEEDDDYKGSLIGAVVALGISIVLTIGYGLTPYFLYIGPGLCLLIPVALIYCMREELNS